MNQSTATMKRLILSRSAALLIAFASTGCGINAQDPDSSDSEPDSQVTSEEQALRAPGGVPALSWRGAPPGAQRNSNQAGLQAVHALSIGVTNNTVVGLQVCWYTPTAANNAFRNGDAFGCTTVGSTSAGSWTTQQCPAGEIVSGYRVGLNRSGDRIAKFATICRSLTSPTRTRTFGFVGDSSILFADTLDCTDHLRTTAYIEYFSANTNFTGFNGVCVLP